MKIKVIKESGKTRGLTVNNLIVMNKIINRFDCWEYK